MKLSTGGAGSHWPHCVSSVAWKTKYYEGPNVVWMGIRIPEKYPGKTSRENVK